MSDTYHEGNRRLQDRFDTRRLADRLDEAIVGDTIGPNDRAFIEQCDMFFLATADEQGRPQGGPGRGGGARSRCGSGSSAAPLPGQPSGRSERLR